jgi:chromate reductase, NAD(P)H dehydrogenase (quinone)
MNFFKNAAVVGCLLFLVTVISPAFDSSISRLLTRQRLRWGQKEIAMSESTNKEARIVGISGSLRKASFNTSLLKILAEKSSSSIYIQVVTLNDIPLYNEDLDTATGVTAVNALKRLISSCDGVLISTPEYNHGIPGVLKNTLDWLSRPVSESCFKNKPVSIISSSKAFTGGVRAQYQLRETLISMQAQLVMGPEVVVGGVHRHFEDESYADESGLIFMLNSLNRLKDAALCHRLVAA